jgi:energy-converting hydrogenase B subunit Q
MEYAALISAKDQPGTLFQLVKVLTEQGADISYVDIIHGAAPDVQVYFEFALAGELAGVIEGFGVIPNVTGVETPPPFSSIYGKRVVIMGGGAQVAQVARRSRWTRSRLSAKRSWRQQSVRWCVYRACVCWFWLDP